MSRRLLKPVRGRSLGGLRQRLVGLCVALCCAASGALAAAPEPDNAQAPPVSYVDANDEQLTALAARWDELAAAERRALLSEVKRRMARRQAGTNGVLSIRLTRRYGAVPQGRTAGQLRIRVGTGQSGAKGFGVGFEQRASQPQAADPQPTEKASTQSVSDPG
ncbi:MAG: hypothetical protein OXE83_07695 [Gammaproteobacteria bacterium]|nr:hypothetical protein [Gammaproteobacteria bacterium]